MDRNTDFSFMKSGFNNLIQPDTNPDPDMVTFIQSLVLSFTECALDKAAIYVQYSGRQMITPQDIKQALKYETFIFLDENNLDERMQKWKEFVEDPPEDSDSEYDEEEFDNDVSLEEDKPINSIDFDNKEHRELYESIKNIDDKWKNWEPTSPIEYALKNVIDNKL